jgi:lysophospholipase L1-like esterase
VSIDGREVADLLRPDHPLWRIDGIAPGERRVRVDIVNESQDGVQGFGGFAVSSHAEALPAPRARARAIEFIGDSYTVGYGAASGAKDCSDDEVWRTTDNSLAFGPLLARRFDADYRVMAISGRGLVRNFSNFAGATLPEAYARQLPGDALPAAASDDAAWSPQLVVIGLGTNDFSTPIGPGEPWKDDAALSTAFEARYVDFVGTLHGRFPAARFILLATGAGRGAAERAVRRVRSRLLAEGIPVGDVLVLDGLALDGCNWHPSRADHQVIARRLAAAVRALIPDWRASPD